MKIVWYQPREVMSQKRLIHLCEDDAKRTLCGIEITQNYILWDRYKPWDVTCKKCKRIEIAEALDNRLE